jgi:hypothetical protein
MKTARSKPIEVLPPLFKADSVTVAFAAQWTDRYV